MKKLALIVVLLAFFGVVNAQDNKKTDHKMKDYVMMKEGKVLVIKDGKSSPMDKEMVLGDGTRVMADGKVMMKDGSTKILKEGETMPLSGNSKMKKDPA